jgi:hypothetical protein
MNTVRESASLVDGARGTSAFAPLHGHEEGTHLGLAFIAHGLKQRPLSPPVTFITAHRTPSSLNPRLNQDTANALWQKRKRARRNEGNKTKMGHSGQVAVREAREALWRLAVDAGQLDRQRWKSIPSGG